MSSQRSRKLLNASPQKSSNGEKPLPDSSKERAKSSVQRPNFAVFLTDDQDPLDTTVTASDKCERLTWTGWLLRE